jgi:hypothetical protein
MKGKIISFNGKIDLTYLKNKHLLKGILRIPDNCEDEGIFTCKEGIPFSGDESELSCDKEICGLAKGKRTCQNGEMKEGDFQVGDLIKGNREYIFGKYMGFGERGDFDFKTKKLIKGVRKIDNEEYNIG